MSTYKSLALLVCGSLTPNLHETYGDYTNVFHNFFRSALPKNIHFKLDPYDVQKMEYPPEDMLDSYDGIVLTGSGKFIYFISKSMVTDLSYNTAASAYKDVDWINKLVAYVVHIANVKPGIKIIGKSSMTIHPTQLTTILYRHMLWASNHRACFRRWMCSQRQVGNWSNHRTPYGLGEENVWG